MEDDPRADKPAALPGARTQNPLALGLVIIGSLAMAVATFLPFDEPAGFRRVEDNTMMQHGIGWILLILAVAIAASGYQVGQAKSDKWWHPLVLCAIAGVLVIWVGNDKDLRTLYPVGLD